MSSRTHQPAPDQAELPGMETHPALIHMLTPEYVGLDPDEFSDITPRMVHLAGADLLRPSLIDIAPGGRSAIGYMSVDTPRAWTREMWLAATPAEYGLLSRNVHKLGQSALNRALAKHPAAEQRTDEVQATAQRAAVHAVESKVEPMESHLTVVRHRLGVTGRFQEMAQHPNLARGSYSTSRERFAALREQVISDMILALGNQREWTEAQSVLAERAIVTSLYIAAGPRQRIQNFSGLVALAGDYNGHKQALIRSRLAETSQYVRAHTPDA